ncbi:MAG: FkbM family methyltransferase [bacterium]|nr:FkbM family methyltransferase [bacterium]
MSKLKMLIRAIRTLKNWPVYLADYLKIVSRPTVVYTLRNGIVCAVRSKTNDRVIFNQIWLQRVYVPQGFEIKNRDLVIDIGAHIGLFSIFAATYAANGRVYAFEPAPENFRMLQRNIRLNKISNIIPANQAVAEVSGTRDFILYKESTAAHSFVFGETEERDIIKVQTVGLDEIVKKNDIQAIDFLKMDCEGAEYETLFNTSPKTLGMIHKISMEYHDMDNERNVNRLKTFLEQNEFTVTIAPHGDSMLYAIR